MARSSNRRASRLRPVSTAPAPSLAGSLSLRENQQPPVGLINFQNSCYFNSVLQCLTFTPPLAQYCLRQLHSTSCRRRREEGDCTFCILEEQIRTSLRILNTKFLAPEKLYMRMMSYSAYFQPENQGDAHELLRFLVADCGKGFQTSSENQHDQQKPVLEGLFGGVLQKQTECQHCGARTITHDNMLDISLEAIRGSLAEAFTGFFRPEVLDGDNKYHCESCNELSAAEMRMSIHRAPKLLTIHLKRFDFINEIKITDIVRFETELSVAEHMSANFTAPGDPQYTLYAVIVHDGRSLYEGHYYAFVKETNGRWYKCTDDDVTDVEERRVLSAQAYLLFYIRSDTVPQ